MTEGEIVLKRIVRIEFFERRGNLDRGFPVLRFSAGQTDTPRYPTNMGIERNNELGFRDIRPDAEIDVPVPHHPPQKQAWSLRRASVQRRREEL